MKKKELEEILSKKNNGGITLIALVITIVVLLILAGISIKVLTGENGLINQAKNGKDAVEISEEKEIVNTAVIQAIGKDRRGDLSTEELQKELDKQTGEGKTEVSDAGEIVEVCFIEKKRYYEVDEDGNIGEPINIVKDEHVGDITKGGKLDGSEEKPYEINCIEDLVTIANRTNGSGNYIDENGNIKEAKAQNNPFKNKNFILTRTLNFESTYSYLKPELKWKYDEEKNAYIIDEESDKTLKEIITDKTGTGFVPIGQNTGSSYKMFWGNLNGQGYTIKNIYENNNEGGLFGSIESNKIENLKLTGKIISNGSKSEAAGFAIIASGAKFYNCSNLIEFEGEGSRSGIAKSVYGSITIINCYNKGNGVTTRRANWLG